MTDIKIPDNINHSIAKIDYLITFLLPQIERPHIPDFDSLSEGSSASLKEEYNGVLLRWAQKEATKNLINKPIEEQLEVLIKECSGLNELKVFQNVKDNMWVMAFNRGYPNSYLDIFFELEDLVQLFND